MSYQAAGKPAQIRKCGKRCKLPPVIVSAIEIVGVVASSRKAVFPRQPDHDGVPHCEARGCAYMTRYPTGVDQELLSVHHARQAITILSESAYFRVKQSHFDVSSPVASICFIASGFHAFRCIVASLSRVCQWVTLLQRTAHSQKVGFQCSVSREYTWQKQKGCDQFRIKIMQMGQRCTTVNGDAGTIDADINLNMPATLTVMG